MKQIVMAGMLASCFSLSATAAPQVAPKGDEGTALSAAIQPKLGITGTCKVSTPDTSGKSARVARVLARMSVWVDDQFPNGTEPPKVYLHREGDDRVFLAGPVAINPLNMGVTPDLTIYQREDGKSPLSIMDHGTDVHWMALSNLGTVAGRLTEYKSSLDAGMLDKMQFTVKNARPSPATMTGPAATNGSSDTVTLLVIKFLGQPRVYGICM